jgi:putative peptidoglycan lipid II flippase
LVLPVVVFATILIAGRALIPAGVYEASHRIWAIACCALAIPAAVGAFWVAWRLRVPEVVQVAQIAARRFGEIALLGRSRKK